MKGLIQRVSEASVTVEERVIARIGMGLVVLLGVEKPDTRAQGDTLLHRIAGYRVFPDAQGRMNLSLRDRGGSLLVVPQFTLAANTRSGTRPGFSGAAPPAAAEALFHHFIEQAAAELGRDRVCAGQFGADMQVALVNDGPVTFLLES